MGPKAFGSLRLSGLLAGVTLAASLGLGGCASLNAKPAGPYGQIEAATFVPPLDMHRVVLQNLDGRNLASTARVAPTASLMIVDPGFVLNTAQSEFYLAPGEHTLSFTAVVNRRDTTTWLHPTLRYSPKDAGVLKLTVEAGKRYSVAARVDGARPEEWEAVVYKVEDIKDYHPSAPGS
jgi:hypothetical protein